MHICLKVYMDITELYLICPWKTWLCIVHICMWKMMLLF